MFFAVTASTAFAVTRSGPQEPRMLRQRDFKRVPVVFLVFDELPTGSLVDARGRVDESLFPNFAELAETATWYRKATTVATFTSRALPAIVTGRYPERTDDPGVEPHSIFTMLGGAYEIRTPNHIPRLCSPHVCGGGYVHSRPLEPASSLRAFPSGSRGVQFRQFVDLIEARREPTFYFQHLVMPHSPWRYLASGQRYDAAEPMPGEVDHPRPGQDWRDDPWLVQQALQRHLLQARLTDRLLGAVLDALRADGLYDRALIVVTADHGLGFVPGAPKRRVTPRTIADLAPVPMVIKLPFQRRGVVSDAPAQTIDLVPTIADALELERVWRDMDGVSLLDDERRDRPRVVSGTPISATVDHVALVRRKYATFGTTPAGSVNLFRLGPGDSEALIGRRIADLAVTGRSSSHLEIADLERRGWADPRAPVFPAFLDATVAASGPETVAAAVDGRIVAVSRTYLAGDERRIAFMLPPRAFGAPPHRLDFFEVVDPETGQIASLRVDGESGAPDRI
jgi:hypothetical protein